jgi:hypothetical protein
VSGQVEHFGDFVCDYSDALAMWILVTLKAVNGSCELKKSLTGGLIDQLYVWHCGHGFVIRSATIST